MRLAKWIYSSTRSTRHRARLVVSFTQPVHSGQLHAAGTQWSASRSRYTVDSFTQPVHSGQLHAAGTQWSASRSRYTVVSFTQPVHSGQLHAAGTQWTASRSRYTVDRKLATLHNGSGRFWRRRGLRVSTLVSGGTGPTIRAVQDFSPRPECTSERESISQVV
jgi:hypothetical protein